MRKLVVSVMQTLDGFITGANENLDWHAVDEEYSDFAVEQLNGADTLLFGRKTYELMQQYWTSAAAWEADPVIAEKMNTIQKVMCSFSEQQLNWNHSCRIGNDTAAEIMALKNQPGKQILVFGSSTLVNHLAACNLIDGFCIILNPVYIGSGRTLISMLPEYLHLKLTHIHEFASGKLMLHYIPLTK